METIRLILTLVVVVGSLGVITFVFKRTLGIYKLNEKIIDMVISYCERHPNTKDLPPADKLFVPMRKKIWSFKKLTVENWVDRKTIRTLKS